MRERDNDLDRGFRPLANGLMFPVVEAFGKTPTFLVAELKDPIGANFLGSRDHIEIWMFGRR
jgi:hypothetical protein